MTRTIKVPKYKLGGTFKPFVVFTKEDYTRIAAALKIPSPSPEIQDKLQEVAMTYDIWKRSLDAMPRESEIETALQFLMKNMRPARDCLENLDGLTKERMHEKSVFSRRAELIRQSKKRWERFEDDRSGKFYDVFSRCLKDMDWLISLAEGALEDLPDDPRGPKKKTFAIQELIRQLAGIFEAERGKKPALTRNSIDDSYSGDFYNLVETCLNVIDKGAIVSNGALAQNILRALEYRQKD
jgi:hypothetical protein